MRKQMLSVAILFGLAGIASAQLQDHNAVYKKYLAQQQAQQQLYQRGLRQPVRQDLIDKAYAGSPSSLAYHRHLIEKQTGRSYTYIPRPTPRRVVNNRFRYGNPNFVDPRFVDPRLGGSRFVDPRFVDPRFVDPRFVDPRFVNQGFGNQGFGNQGFGNQGFGNPAFFGQPVLLIPNAGFFPNGIRAVVSPDRRYVRIGF
ncbi:MAG: hypothetical protein N2C14_07745 [Planctomycetales bacterium]